MIETNLLFLNGDIDETFYHGGPLNSETIENKDFLNDVIELNKQQIFTYDSQPCLFNKQRSYISFHCNIDLIEKLFDKLKNDKNIYFSCKTSETYYDNMECEKLNLSRNKRNGKWNKYTNWWKNNYIEDDCVFPSYLESLIEDEYPVVCDLLENSTDCMIILKNFKNDISAPNILLNYINSI